MKLKVSFVVTSAAALNEDLRLEVAAACAFDIVAYMVAVFFGGEPRDSEFAAVDALLLRYSRAATPPTADPSPVAGSRGIPAD